MTTETMKNRKQQKLRNSEYYDLQIVHDELYLRSLRGATFTNLMDRIMDERNVRLAYRNLKTNKGKNTPGTDGKIITDLERLSTDELAELVRSRLQNFQPQVIRRVMIPKPNGKERPLGIPTIEDKLVQQCIKQVLEPILEAKFYKHSYGFRPNRSTEHAIKRLFHLTTCNKLHYAVDVDIKSFFDEVDHGKLLKQVWTLGVRDKPLLKVISKMLKAEVENEGIQQKGLPQGGVLSTVLANVVLNELDWWIHSQWQGVKTRTNFKTPRIKTMALQKTKLKEIHIVRYCDDFKILCRTAKDAQKTFVAVKEWLNERLGLEVNHEKSKVVSLRKNRSEFLGFEVKVKPKKKGYVMKSNVSQKSLKRMKMDIKKRLASIKKNPTPANCKNYNQAIIGRHNYYSLASNCNLDFNKLYFSVRNHLFNKTKHLRQKDGVITESYKKLYGQYNYKITTIAKVTLFPIGGVKMRRSKPFNPEICGYTEDGRSLIHTKLQPFLSSGIKYLLDYPDKCETVSVNDIRLSKYSGQQGKCYISGKPLDLEDIVTHRITTTYDDNYSNIVLINKIASYLVHESNKATLSKIIKDMSLSVKGYNRLMNLRKEIGNFVIN